MVIKAEAEDSGLDVLVGSNGREALQLAVDERPDIIVLDLRMPPPDGYNVLAHLKDDERTKKIPVIILAAIDSYEDRMRAIRLGAHDVLEKPFTTTMLLRRVRDALEKSARGEI